MASEPRGRPSRAIAIGLAFITLMVYGRVCGFDFLSYDDPRNVASNPHLNPASWSGLFYFWRHSYYSLYMPVTYTVYLALATVGRLPHATVGPGFGSYSLNPYVFHAANLCFQILNVLLVYVLLRCFVRRAWAAAAGALLFGIHPVQVEAVAWVTGLNNLLAGAFALVALRQYTLFAQSDRDGRSPREWRRHYAWATAAFALALLSKPIAVTVPAMAWAIDRWMVGRRARACARPLVAWLGMAVLCVLVTQSAQSQVIAQTPLLSRPLMAGDALDFYLFKLFVPLRLCPHYGRTPNWLLAQNWRFYAVVPPLLLGIAIWSQRRRYHCLSAAVCIFVFGVLPTLGLVPTYYQAFSTVADRYLYLAMLGPALLLACLLDRPRRAADGAAAIVLLLLAALSWRQVGYWRDTHSIFEHTLAVNPQSWISYVQLGNVLHDEGHPEAAIAAYKASLRLYPLQTIALNDLGTILLERRQLDAAQACFAAAIAVDPSDEPSQVNLDRVLIARGRIRKAIENYRAFLRDKPDSETINYHLAQALMQQGNLREAKQPLELVLRINPDNALAHINLATLLDELGQTEGARSHYARGVALLPGSAQANSNYGLFLLHHGQAADALPLLIAAVKLDPRDAQYRYNLGLVLAHLQRAFDAADQFSAALALDPRYVEARYNLGIEQMELGQTDAAIAAWRRALAINPTFSPARQALDSARREVPSSGSLPVRP